MRSHNRSMTASALITTLSALSMMLTSPVQAAKADDGLHALAGEWIYVEDRTEGRALEQMGPPMSAKFSLAVDEGAVVLVSGHGSGHRDVRIALDGSITEVAEQQRASRYRGTWSSPGTADGGGEGMFAYDVDFVRAPDSAPEGLIRREFRHTADGLLVRVIVGSPARFESTGLYRHAEDIAMPEPAEATIDDLNWLAGAWVGTRGSRNQISMEERWCPPLGGAMLAISRTVSDDSMRAFEFLRIVERDGGLVYIAQPNGGSPTEFVMTDLTSDDGGDTGTRRAVFDNPRHDYPKRIVYELSDDGGLTATIGFMKGGSPRRFEFQREGQQRPAID